MLSSDEPVFGGYSNVTKDSETVFVTDEGTYDNRPHSFQVLSNFPTQVPCRDNSSILMLAQCAGTQSYKHTTVRACTVQINIVGQQDLRRGART